MAMIAIGESPEVLSSIANPATTLAIWRRRLSDGILGAAQQIGQTPFELITLLNPNRDEDRQRFEHDLNGAIGLDNSVLAEDLLNLARKYKEASRTNTIRLRFETVEDDGCSRFHLDNVVMRLVVTYRGRGTEWVGPAFGSVAYRQQEHYAGPVNSMRTGDVALFQGRKSGVSDLIFHRSPPMRPGDGSRLVAVIDGVEPKQM